MTSTLWLVDRSRIEDGRSTCQRSRALGYHLGPNGYGIALKGTRLPLVTGIMGHEGIAPVLEWCRDHDGLILQGLQVPMQEGEQLLPIPREVVRAGVQQAQARYAQVVTTRGFAYLEDETTQYVVREQQYLIEGLIWAWCLEVLPELLRRGRVVEVEHDDTFVFACTCGLGDGVLQRADHEARGCLGIGLMCRPDFLLEARSGGALEYHEFKTTGMDSISFREKWEVMIQMVAAVLDAERRHGKPISSVYIHALVKGKREGEYNPATKAKDGAPRQQSVFCYGFRKPANPPMEQEEWAATWDYYDPHEERWRTLGKSFKKTGVWELPEEYLPSGMGRAEYWATSIPPEARKKNLVLIGPLDRQTQMVEHFLQECEGEEHRWQDGLWQLYECAEQILHGATWKPGEGQEPTYWTHVWPHPDYQRLLDRIFPRSYACRRYGARHRCQFEDICLEREGWMNPLESGRFIERRPHHRDELEQAIGRGLLLPEEGLAEGEEEEG